MIVADSRTALTLTLRAPPCVPLDMSPLTPNALAGKRWADIASIPLAAGNRTLRTADVFDIAGEDTTSINVRGGSERLIRVGGSMTTGTLSIEGDVGLYAGAQMQGGRLVIGGNAGAFAGCEMLDGVIHIRGNAGDFLGSARAGMRLGMQGGAVIVDGCVADRAGDRMRRGMLLIGRDAGDFCAARMLAGTIVVRGDVGSGAGCRMRRGTLVLARLPTLPDLFSDCGNHALPFLRVLRRYLRGAGAPFADFAALPESVHRYVGDRGCNGLGEILVAQ
jgi:formylmethanofuran dehydrogenase subunit C